MADFYGAGEMFVNNTLCHFYCIPLWQLFLIVYIQYPLDFI